MPDSAGLRASCGSISVVFFLQRSHIDVAKLGGKQHQQSIDAQWFNFACLCLYKHICCECTAENETIFQNTVQANISLLLPVHNCPASKHSFLTGGSMHCCLVPNTAGNACKWFCYMQPSNLFEMCRVNASYCLKAGDGLEVPGTYSVRLQRKSP